MKIHHMGFLAVVAVGSWAASMTTTACSSSSSPASSSGGSSGSSSGGSEDGSVADTGSSSGATDSGSGSDSGSSGSSGGSPGDGGACIPQNGTYTLTVTAFSGNSHACPAASDLGLPATLVCPGDAGACLPTASDKGCSCAGTTLTCTSMFKVDGGATIDETLNLDFAQADFSGSETLSSGGVPCLYSFTASM